MIEQFWEASRPLFDPDGFLHLTLGLAHEAVVALGRGLPQEIRPRATCAACVVQGSNAYWAHIGDSRVYMLRGGRILERTRDHSHVELLLREGLITEDQLNAAIGKQQTLGMRLGSCLIDMGMIEADTIAKVVGRQLHAKPILENEIRIDPDLIAKIADERNVTSVEDLLAFLEETGHPALTMPPIF